MSDALDVLYSLVTDNGERWGTIATDWQKDDAAAILEPQKKAPTLHWLGRPKGGSKTTDVSGLGIAWLVEQAPALADGYVAAADKDQANRLLDRARGFISRTPGLDGVLQVQANRITHVATGARIHALEADAPSVEGLLTPFAAVDELPNWPDTPSARRMWLALVSAIPKWPGMRLIVIGHAGDPAHFSHDIYLKAKNSKRWHVNDIAGPLSWVSKEDLDEQKTLLLPSEYQRRHLNQWVSSEDRLTTTEDLDACVGLDGVQSPVMGVRYVVGVDIGITNDRSVVSVCHAEGDDGARRVVLDRQAVWQGSRKTPVSISEVETWISNASQSYNRAPVVFDPFQAVQLAERLRHSRVKTVQFNFTASSVGELAMTLYQLIRSHRLLLPNDADLLDELRNVRLRQTSAGTVRLDHDSGKHDDRAISLALACHHLLNAPRKPQMRFRGAYDHMTDDERRMREYLNSK